MSLNVPTALLEQAEAGTVTGDTYQAFTSPRGQLLNQSPELRDC